jgi:hypothetical protein
MRQMEDESQYKEFTAEVSAGVWSAMGKNHVKIHEALSEGRVCAGKCPSVCEL